MPDPGVPGAQMRAERDALQQELDACSKVSLLGVCMADVSNLRTAFLWLCISHCMSLRADCVAVPRPTRRKRGLLGDQPEAPWAGQADADAHELREALTALEEQLALRDEQVRRRN